MHTEPYKYLAIKEYVIDLINSSKIAYGEKIPSENELSLQFGISRQTVRQAIKILANEGWLNSIHGSGTYVQRTHERQKKKTRTIGVIITYPDDYIFPNIIAGIENTLFNMDYNINLGFTYNKVEKEAQCLKSFIEEGADGLIIEGSKSALPNPNLSLYEILSKKRIPYIFINGYYGDLKSSYITMDDEDSAFIATEYLIGKGHKIIGGIFKSDDIQGHLRYKGFVKALHTHGLQLPENSVFWFTTQDMDAVLQKKYSITLISRFHNCSAIVCYNDQIAIKLIASLKSNCINVPENVSIISFDNSTLAELSNPPLTSMIHIGSELGKKAAKMIVEMINTQKTHHEKIKSTLVERDSVKSIIKI